MRASISALAAILGAAQLAAASGPTESVQNARVARDGFYKCAQMTVPEYDDLISPANVVAKAIAFKCRTWIDAMVKLSPRTEATQLHDEIMRGEEGGLLGIVLRHRVLKSTPPPLVAATGARAQTAPSTRSVQTRTAPK